jgi:hypothetical protein
MKRALLVVSLCLAPITAYAQEGGTPPPTPTPVATDGGGDMGGKPAIFRAGTMGLGFNLFGLDFGPIIAAIAAAGGGMGVVLPPANIDLAYFLSEKAALDLILGIKLAAVPNMAPATGSTTTFGLEAGVGYRMYMKDTGKIHTFLEPEVVLGAADFSNFGDTFVLNISGNMGVEAMFTDWFSVSGTVGLGLDFSQKFKNIFLGTVQGGLNANFYWH